jgi:purine-nucleoside/S-methyl-5'-thioadenosine phosphorylase / adenosine deaminase
LTVQTVTLPDVAAPFAWRQAGEVVWLEATLGSATAAFSTRLGGSSDGPYRSLNLGVLTDDDRGRVVENRRMLASAVGRDVESIAMGRQVHGTELQVRDARPAAGAPLLEADAQVTSSPALTPLVLVADCVPLVLAGPDVVAAVHCGWRGIAGGIVERAVALAGDDTQENVKAALGPGIGSCCYAVGDEVREAFRARGHQHDVLPEGRLDLALAIRRELEDLGVNPEEIRECGLCTSCHPELFFSHRRDGGVTGRQAGLAWLGS